MIYFENASVHQLILHRVTNEESSSTINSRPFQLMDEEQEKLFIKILVKPFAAASQTFEFYHEVDLQYNVLCNLAKKMQENTDDFTLISQEITRHLLSVSRHPNINDGDLFIARFSGIEYQGQLCTALGIYKFEDKESFVETIYTDQGPEIRFRKGIASKKPDKACLILYTEENNTILVLDNRAKDTEYWHEEFIKHQLKKKDPLNQTMSFLNMTKNYINKQLDQDFEVEKADKIDLLNRSVEYFKSKELFDKEEFENEVLRDKNVIDSFHEFDAGYRKEKELHFPDNFEISDQAVKKQARVFKSVLKLDKNFHIYIHGNRELIQKGTDEHGRKYYKIYYEEES